MKITATLKSVSLDEHRHRPEAGINRRDLAAVTFEVRGANGLRALVGITEHGLTVTTSRLAEGAKIEQDDAWIDDTSIVCITNVRTTVVTLPEAEVLREDPHPY